MNNLADVYTNLHRYADAERLLKRSMAVTEKAFGPDHPDVAQALNNLAAVYVRQGRNADAERFFKRSVATFEKTLGPNHPDLADVLENLAGLYKDQSRYAGANASGRWPFARRQRRLAVVFQEVVHLIRTEEAEVAKLQCSREDQMDVHKNAPLTPKGREAMVRGVMEGGLSKAAAARQFNITPKIVAKWVERFRAEGVDGLRDRSSLGSPTVRPRRRQIWRGTPCFSAPAQCAMNP
jgi:tetratricopeptide (TPR) repeat protein